MASSKTEIVKRFDKFLSSREKKISNCAVCRTLSAEELEVIHEAKKTYLSQLTKGHSNKSGANNAVILAFLREDLGYSHLTIGKLRWHFSQEHFEMRAERVASDETASKAGK